MGFLKPKRLPMPKRIPFLILILAGLLAFAQPTPALAWEWIISLLKAGKYLSAPQKAAKAVQAFEDASTLAEKAAKKADDAMRAAEILRNPEAAAEARWAKRDWIRAADEAAKKKKARDEAMAASKEEEKSSFKETAEEVTQDVVKEGAQEVVERVGKKEMGDGSTEANAEKQLSPLERYLLGIPAIMLGAILFLGGIICLLEPRYKNDEERRAAIREQMRRNLEKVATKFTTTGKHPGVWLKV
jgi:hypothetical protein